MGIQERSSPLRYLRVALVAAALLTTRAAVAAPPAWVADELLAAPKPGVMRDEVESIYREHGARVVRELSQIGVHVLRVPAQALPAIEKALSKRGEFEFVERNRVLRPALSPNDPSYWKEWHLPRINAPEAWDVTVGSSAVTIAILDTGVDATHPDLAGKLVPGFNTYDHTTDTSDLFGHGTSVAGTAAAASNNAAGVASVAWASPLMPIRVVEPVQGYAYTSTVAEGLTWAVDHGARVMNVSFADVEGDATIRIAAQYVAGKGGVVVVAAGNCACVDPSPEDPYILSVSATGQDDALTDFSSRGSYVDLAAPGIGIQSTVRGGTYASFSGTSFSSPIVAGIVALMMSANPSIGPEDVEAILEGTAVDLGAPGHDTSFGFGLVDAAAAVQAAAQSAPPPADTTAPSASITSPASGGTVSGTTVVNVTAFDDRGVSKVELYVDGALVGSDATIPFSFSWDATAASAGPHALQAKAYDVAGNSALSPVTTVNIAGDTTPPTLQFTSPANRSTAGKTTTKITLAATDDRQVTSLEVLVDGVSLGSTACSAASCSATFTWRSQKAARGSHLVSGVGRDAAGNLGSATPLTLMK